MYSDTKGDLKYIALIKFRWDSRLYLALLSGSTTVNLYYVYYVLGFRQRSTSSRRRWGRTVPPPPPRKFCRCKNFGKIQANSGKVWVNLGRNGRFFFFFFACQLFYVCPPKRIGLVRLWRSRLGKLVSILHVQYNISIKFSVFVRSCCGSVDKTTDSQSWGP